MYPVLRTSLSAVRSVPCRIPHLRHLLFKPHFLQLLCSTRPLASDETCRTAPFIDRCYPASGSGLAVP